MSLRAAPLQPAPRFIALGCVLLWLSAVSYCSVDELFGRSADSHPYASRAEAATVDSHAQRSAQTGRECGDAASYHNANSNGHDSHRHHGPDGVCCSNLHATAQTPQPAFDQPAFHPVVFHPALPQPIGLISAASEHAFGRRTNTSEWVFRPEVCLGPAVRSHAPPFLPVT